MLKNVNNFFNEWFIYNKTTACIACILYLDQHFPFQSKLIWLKFPNKYLSSIYFTVGKT